MIIIVGLGNPGEKFKTTRHNIGFMAVDFLAEKNNFPEFKLSKKYNALISEKDKILLVKPQTFMNDSGKAVKKIISNLKFKISNLIVIHDDIDLPLGKLKIVKNRGSGGHKGVESVMHNIGNKDFIRFRLGIQPKKGKPKSPKDFVLKSFSKEELKIVDAAIDKTAKAIHFLIDNGLERTMNRYNAQ